MKNNKGFSLVELIIVIAIMAILAGAIAPALIRYIDKSRKSNDISSAKTIKTAVETAMTNEDSYAGLTSDECSITLYGTAINFGSIPDGTTGADIEPWQSDFKSVVLSNLNGKCPKFKFKKECTDGGKATAWEVVFSADGTIKVGVNTTNSKGFVQLAPEQEGEYK